MLFHCSEDKVVDGFGLCFGREYVDGDDSAFAFIGHACGNGGNSDVCIFTVFIVFFFLRCWFLCFLSRIFRRFLCIGWSDGDGDGRIFLLSSCGRVGASVGVYAVFGKGSSHGGKGRESKRSQEGCGKSFMVHG